MRACGRGGWPRRTTTTRVTNCAGAGTIRACSARATTSRDLRRGGFARRGVRGGRRCRVGRATGVCAASSKVPPRPGGGWHPWSRWSPPVGAFGLPFVDYMRGDGTAVGPGQALDLGRLRGRRHDPVGAGLPRALGAGHPRRVRRRASARRSPVRARRRRSHLVGRSAGVGRAAEGATERSGCGRGPARAGAGHGSPGRGARRGGRRRTGRATAATAAELVCSRNTRACNRTRPPREPSCAAPNATSPPSTPNESASRMRSPRTAST